MTKEYACLIGNWVCLNDDPNCKIGGNLFEPTTWWEENAEIWNPKKIEQEHTMYQMPYVNLCYLGTNYRIHPAFIQIVEEP